MKRGKKYQEALKAVDRTKVYAKNDAVELIKKLSYAKFDETVELSMNLNVKKSTTIRDTLVLPHQFRGEKKILVFAKGDKAEEARKAGAAFVGDDDMIEKVKGGWTDFDVAVATPDMMKDVGKLGHILGRRGLMPNPKTQTVTFDVTAAINELKKGRVEFRSDKTGVIHMPVGKVSMEIAQLLDNINAVVSEVERKRPSDTKGEFVKSVALSATMGPGLRIARESE